MPCEFQKVFRTAGVEPNPARHSWDIVSIGFIIEWAVAVGIIVGVMGETI